MNPLFTLSILVKLAQIINFLNDFQKSFNFVQRFSLSRNHYVLKNCCNPVNGCDLLTRTGDNPAVLSPDVDTCIRVRIESTVAGDAITIGATKNSLFSGGA